MMSDLESLREIFKDVRQWIGIGVITQMELASDNSTYYAQVKLLPDGREVIGYMSFADVSDVTFPEINDMVLVAFADGEQDQCHIVSRYCSTEELVPLLARSGHSVKYSRPGKKMYIGSNVKVGIGKIDSDPSSPLVLGDVLKNFATDFINAILNATQIGTSAAGPVVLDPGMRTALNAVLNTYVTTAGTNFVSQIAYTERGP